MRVASFCGRWYRRCCAQQLLAMLYFKKLSSYPRLVPETSRDLKKICNNIEKHPLLPRPYPEILIHHMMRHYPIPESL